jgi:hypothetical protein
VIDEIVAALATSASVRECLNRHDTEDVRAPTGGVLGRRRVGRRDSHAHDERDRSEQQDETMHENPLG